MKFEIVIPPEQLRQAVEDVLRKSAPAMEVTPRLSYRIKEAAAATGLSVSYFRAQIRAKKINAITLGRTKLIRADELERILTEKAKEQAKWSTKEETFGGLNLPLMVN